MASGAVEQRVYQVVSPGTTVTTDLLIANGDTIQLSDIGANTAADSVAVISWDPAGANEIIISCSGNTDQRTGKQCLGNGTKVLRISLQNTGLVDCYMGAYFLGQYV